MKRVMVIGAPGTGKSTFAVKLAEKTGGEFLRKVWNFRKNYRPDTLKLLAENADKQIVTFKTRKQADEYLRMV